MPDFPCISPVDPASPDPQAIEIAGKTIRSGGVVVFPAQCLYGLACDAANPDAVGKIFDLKQRPETKALLILINSPHQIPGLVKEIPEAARILMDAFWPGGITLVFGAADHLGETLTAGTGKIGIRLPAHPVARALVSAAGCPITGTSANLSGQPGCNRAADLPREITHGADQVLDAGQLKGGAGSTVVDVTTLPLTLLREGFISKGQIRTALGPVLPAACPL